MVETTKKIQVGVMKTPLNDVASSGLAFLLRTVEGKHLTPMMFCKDFFQDFIFVNSVVPTKKFIPVYGYDPEVFPNLLEENPKFNLLMFPFSKQATSKEDYLNSPKTKLAYDCILNTDVIKSFKEQLEIFENQLIKIGYINFKTEVEVVTIEGKYPKEVIEQNAISVTFDNTYFHKPELFSLYVLFLRNFLTMKIFVKDFEDIYVFFRDFHKYELKYLYEQDLMIFNNPAVKLNLPMYLTDKLAYKTWDHFKDFASYTLHNTTGIFSYLTSKLLTNV
jgi:hypothetical protein